MVDFSRTCYVQCCLSILAVAELSKVQTTKTTGTVLSCRTVGCFCSMAQRWLSTAPGAPTTHWYQLRCVLSQPLYVLAGQPITGRLHLVAHSSQSYTIHLTMSASMWGPGGVRGGVLQTSTAKLDLKEPYYRMSQSPAYAWTQQDQASQYREETIAQQQVSSLIQLFRS
jgi:hypothetical protein